MKKRKRKMRTTNLCDAMLLLLLAVASITQVVVLPSCVWATIALVQANQPATFDEEFHLLNLTYASSEDFITRRPAVAKEFHSKSKSNERNRTISLTTTAKENQLIVENSLDDLLAVETSRLLTIGKQQQQQLGAANNSNNTQQLAAPYENLPANLTDSSQQVSNSNYSTDTQETSSASRPPSQRQFIKLFRQPVLVQPPLLLPPPPSTLVVPVVRSTTLGHYHHQAANSINLPIWPGSYLPPAGERTSGKPVITTVAPPTWSAYSEFANSQQQINETKTGADFNKEQTSFIDFTSDRLKKGGKEINIEGSEHETNQENGQNAAVTKFPSLISSEAQNSEDEFEKNLMAGQFNHPSLNSNSNLNLNSSNLNKTNLTLNWNQLLRQATESNVMESLMVTNRSMVSLLCDTNDMLVRLKFKHPFKGIVSTNLDRLRSCRLIGNGSRYYEMRISLRDCGTRQEMPRLFINNIQIQFRNQTTSGGGGGGGGSQFVDVVGADDEIKTIICSYPIRPRAPPPPEFPPTRSMLPERIIELTNDGNNNNNNNTGNQLAAAKLVYYEPLFLISGLLLFALVLLGLTTGAYMFTKQRQRQKRNGQRFDGTARNSFSSSRIYRNPPAQIANRNGGGNLLLSPPLIRVPKTTSPRRYGTSMKHTTNKQISNSLAVNDNKKDRPELRREVSSSTLPRSKTKIIPLPGPTILKKNEDLKKRSNSLIQKNEQTTDSLKSSVTTIEIPFAGSKAQLQQSDIPAKTSITTKPKVPIKPKRLQQQQQLNTGSEYWQKQANILRKVREKKSKEEVTKETRGDNDDDDDVRQKQQEEHIGQTLRFGGSLRKTLTSPNEYKRLQEIVRMFGEIVIENHIDKGSEGTIVLYNTRLNPSKYKTKIMDKLSEQERKQLGELLQTDEVFRSLVVESTNRQTFRRKLRNNPVYSGKFSNNTWDLFEEILLDPDIVSTTTTTTTTSSELSEESSSIRFADETSSTPPIAYEVEKKDIKKNVDPEDEESILRASNSNQPLEFLAGSGQGDSLNSPSSPGSSLKSSESLNKLDTPPPPPPPPITSSFPSYKLATELKQKHHQVEGRRITTKEHSTDPRSQSTTESVSTSIRVSQFNSTRVTRGEGGLAGTLINIDSVTNFTSSEDFSTYTRSSIEHRRFDDHDHQGQVADTTLDSLPYVDEIDHQTSSTSTIINNNNNNNNQNYDYNTRPLPIKRHSSRTTINRADTPSTFRPLSHQGR